MTSPEEPETPSPEEPGTTSPEEHASRFDEKAAEYDEDASPEYRECVALVVARARAALRPGDVVLDLGTGTGAVAFGLAGADEFPDEGRVVGRDPSEGMLAEAERKAATRGVENVTFGTGRFRDPSYDGPADVVTSNFAMHHLDDAGKREAIDVVAALGPRRFVLGDVMLFGAPDPEEPYYDPSVDDPATVGVLVDAVTDAGFVVTAVDRVHEQVGVLVADRPDAVADLWPDGDGSPTGGGDGEGAHVGVTGGGDD